MNIFISDSVNDISLSGHNWETTPRYFDLRIDFTNLLGERSSFSLTVRNDPAQIDRLRNAIEAFNTSIREARREAEQPITNTNA